MTTHPVQRVLDRFGARMDEDMVATVLEEALSSGGAPGVVEASAHDRDIALQRSGLSPAEQEGVRATLRDPGAVADLRASAAVRASSWTVTALTQEDVMRRLGLRTPSGLSRRISENRVVVVVTARGRLFPAWQFVDVGDGRLVTLPHLEDVVPAAAELHPAVVAALMVTPQGDLDGATPAQWLVEGAPVAPVVDLLRAQSAW